MKIIKSDSDDLGGILYWGILPALLFRTIYNSGGINRDDVNLLCAVYLSFLIMPFLSLIFFSLEKRSKKAWRFAHDVHQIKQYIYGHSGSFACNGGRGSHGRV